MKRILVVDDESDVALAVKLALKKFGDYEVTCVNSGKRCLDLLENDWVPDLILLDIMMPDMNGWEVHKKLQRDLRWRDIPIVFLTAITDETSHITGSVIADGYVEKPFDPVDLKKVIDDVLQKSKIK